LLAIVAGLIDPVIGLETSGDPVVDASYAPHSGEPVPGEQDGRADLRAPTKARQPTRRVEIRILCRLSSFVRLDAEAVAERSEEFQPAAPSLVWRVVRRSRSPPAA
jgi:hypothetical protein